MCVNINVITKLKEINMLKVCIFKNMAANYNRVKNTSNNVLSRTHYINFLKEEDKFFSSAKKFNGYAQDWSLKIIPEFFNSLKFMAKMGIEKLKSAYYYNK